MKRHNKENKNQMLNVVNYQVMFEAFLVGALLAQVFILATLLGEKFLEITESRQNEIWIWVIIIFYTLISVHYFCRKKFWIRMKFIIRSLRLDLLILLVSGMIFDFAFGGRITNIFKAQLKTLSWLQVIVIILFPIMIYISLILRKLQGKLLKKNENSSCFISDKEGNNKNDDKFDFSHKAESFAESVFDNKSSDGLVFGIDAPWGTGKLTFVNLCKEYWSEKHKGEMIVYTFEPLKYENKEELSGKFIDGFIKEIRNHIYAPEIELLVSKYAKLLRKSKPSFSFLAVSFSFSLRTESLNDVFEKLDKELRNIDKKIVIIIDDLDRLNFSAIKEVLFFIKKAFTLPNISYILCYDTENIDALEKKNSNIEKINEFLEKFINVKTGIYLDNKLLLEYFIENKDETLSRNDVVSKAIEGLKDIFTSKDFHRMNRLLVTQENLRDLLTLLYYLK